MPRFHSYSDKEGYYILARPPDAGNITYQVSNRAEVVLQSMGFTDGDEISWDTINALRVPNLIYTGESGTTNQDEIPLNFKVEEEVDDLDITQRRDLASMLVSKTDLEADSKRKIGDILGVCLEEIEYPEGSLNIEVQPHHMEDSLETVSAQNWHPQDVILVCQALHRLAESGDLTDARGTRAYALLFGLIDSSDIRFDHTEFNDYQHLSDIATNALQEWMHNQADETWGEELVLDEDEL